MSGIVLDLILVILLIIFALVGFYRGFFKELISLGGLFGSLFIAYYLYKPFVDVLNSLFGWGVNISNFVMNQVGQIAPAFATNSGGTVEELQDIITNSGGGVAYEVVLKELVKKADFANGPMTVATAVGNVVAGFVMVIISFVILFLLLRIVVFILNKIFSAIPRKSAIGVVNKWLGLGIGTIKGALSLSMLLVLVYLLCLIPSVNNLVQPYMDSSYVVKHVYNFLGNYILGVVN
jgi:uncharacterized membrane protein required for colicin V production